jgi:mycobactin lysine-N-oxygenase
LAWLLLKSNGMNLTTASEQKTLVIIGAGPKAAAIVAKAHCLKRIGMRVPRITIIEKNCVAANWTGEHGFTNGKFRLGTSPDKDIGYPYPAHPRLNSTQQKKLQQQMLQLSWSQYLIQKECYSWWIDADRPAPTHSEWASYINWVLTQTRESHQYLNGEVKTISFQSLQPWEIQFLSIEGMRSLKADGLMITGPGDMQSMPGYQAHPNLLNNETYWKNLEAIRNLSPKRVAVVGTGENAASILQHLNETIVSSDSRIDLFSTSGTVHSRGESLFENQVYSHVNADMWQNISLTKKKDFIQRTDRGVFSQRAMQILRQYSNIHPRLGRVLSSEVKQDGRIQLSYLKNENAKLEQESYDLVVLATGPNPIGFLERLIDEPSRRLICQNSGFERFQEGAIEKSIDSSLAIKNLFPLLHLPMLSAQIHGPGFANLSCLGTLSDCILEPYIESGA